MQNAIFCVLTRLLLITPVRLKQPAAQLTRRLKTKIAKEDGQERDLYVSMTQPLFS